MIKLKRLNLDSSWHINFKKNNSINFIKINNYKEKIIS